MVLSTYAVSLPFLLSALGVLTTHARAIDTSDITISWNEMRNKGAARANKPIDAYTPHEAPVYFAALGDSYTAGPGAGERYSDDHPVSCYTTKASYGVQLDQDFPWDVEHKFFFAACSGHRIPQMLEMQIPLLKKQKRQDFILMTIGGNDAEFSKIVRICALGIRVPAWDYTCEEQLKRSREIVHSADFEDRLIKLYDELFKQLDKEGASEYYQLYHILYPEPFRDLRSGDVDQDPWCNDKTFFDECTNIQPTEGPKLSLELREELNRVTREIDDGLYRAALKFTRSKQHAPGWFRNRLWMVNPEDNWYGHKFCEIGARSFDDPNIHFIPYCDRAQGDSVDASTVSIEEYNLPDNCNEAKEYAYDDAFVYKCTISKLRRDDPNRFPPGTKTALPENWAKIFHPRANGFAALKKELTDDLRNLRPPMGESQCVVVKFIIPGARNPLQQGQRMCRSPGEETEPPPEQEEPTTPPAPPPPPPPPQRRLIVGLEQIGSPRCTTVNTPLPNMPPSTTCSEHHDYINKYFFYTLENVADVDSLCTSFLPDFYHDDAGWTNDPNLFEYPTWPKNSYPDSGITWNLSLFGEDYVYKNDNQGNAGALWKGNRRIGCWGDLNMHDPHSDEWCENTLTRSEGTSRKRRRLVECKW